MTKVGFTGTQDGMTERQRIAVANLLMTIEGCEFHHGDCVGADKEAWEFARLLNYRTICHPPIKSKLRAFTENNEEMPAKPYLDRNKDIVNESEILIVCPKGMYEVLRSGTWSTKRYAEKCNRNGKKIKIIIVWPFEKE